MPQSRFVFGCGSRLAHGARAQPETGLPWFPVDTPCWQRNRAAYPAHSALQAIVTVAGIEDTP